MKITKSREWYYRANVITTILAWLFCVVPTAIAALIKLPSIVTTKSETTLTGGAIVVIACCAYPILKGVLKMLKSPSAWLILLVLASVTTALYCVPYSTLGAMVAIFWTAAGGNIVGAVLFWLAQRFAEKGKLCGRIGGTYEVGAY